MRRNADATQEYQAPNVFGSFTGNFNLSGHWDPAAERLAGRDLVYELVLRLVRTRRRHPDLVPEDFVDSIRVADFLGAFPSVTRGGWDACRNWLSAAASTAAERSVVAAGYASIPSPVGEVSEVTQEIAVILRQCGLGSAEEVQTLASLGGAGE